MTGQHIDSSDVRALARDLERAGPRTVRVVEPVMKRAALNVKRELQAEAREGLAKSKRFRRLSAAISYDVFTTDEEVEAEIGAETGAGKGSPRSQGGLAGYAYEGSARSGPVLPDPMGALEREAGVFEDYVARGLEELW